MFHFSPLLDGVKLTYKLINHSCKPVHNSTIFWNIKTQICPNTLLAHTYHTRHHFQVHYLIPTNVFLSHTCAIGT